MSKPRNWPYVQQPLDQLDLAAAFFDEPGSTEARMSAPTWIPPHLPATPEGAACTMYSIFGWWWANYEIKDSTYGYWSYLHEWVNGDWQFVTKTHGETIGQAFTAAAKAARRLLIEGQRPEAQKQSPELDGLVRYWQSHGQHMLARDNPKLVRVKP